jgi:hypothetical protein
MTSLRSRKTCSPVKQPETVKCNCLLPTGGFPPPTLQEWQQVLQHLPTKIDVEVQSKILSLPIFMTTIRVDVDPHEDQVWYKANGESSWKSHRDKPVINLAKEIYPLVCGQDSSGERPEGLSPKRHLVSVCFSFDAPVNTVDLRFKGLADGIWFRPIQSCHDPSGLGGYVGFDYTGCYNKLLVDSEARVCHLQLGWVFSVI